MTTKPLTTAGDLQHRSSGIYYLASSSSPRSRRVRGSLRSGEPKVKLPEILINHVDDDIVLAEQIHMVLQAQSWESIFNSGLPIGRRLDEYLEVALQHVDCVVTLWSASSVGSPRVRDVVNEAQRRGISLPLSTEEIELPLGHRSVRTISLRECQSTDGSYDFEPLVASIEALLSGVEQPTREADVESEPSLSLRVARRVIEELQRESPANAAHVQTSPEVFTLGEWKIDAGSNSVSSGQSVKKLSPRAMEVLVYLTSRSPGTVSVNEILDTVWKDRVVVDSAVHRCVRELRQVLEDDVRDPRYIQTYSKRGYRVIADIALAGGG